MKSRVFIFIMFALLLVRCTDTETFIPNPDPVTFKASAFVQVTDVQGTPLEGVKILVGNIQGYTNAEGILYLRDIDMNSSTYLTAEQPGYFHGSRRFSPAEGQTQLVKIILMPDQVIGTFASGTGGTVSLPNGVSLAFPSDAVADHSGQPYTGTVSVSAQLIKADDPDLSFKMPGDLIGIRTTGKKGSLGSFGMMAVELKSASGELLNVKNGSLVEMRMEVPASQLGSAPSTIPMWYFDENLGFWKEEGEASLVENLYVAQLAHFSFWNCDAWFELVKWGATFVYENASPASQVLVCITIPEYNTTSCAYTNDQGLVCGSVAANQTMLLEVKSPCGDVVYSQQIGPYSDTTLIGPITIPSVNVSTSEVSGIAIDCNGDPVTHGYAIIQVGEQSYYAELDEITGAFSVSVMNCDEGDVTIKVLDETALKQSLPLTFGYAPVIDAGSITVCETISEYIDLEVVGFTDHFIWFFPAATISGGVTTIVSQDSTNQGKFFYVRFNGDTEGTYTPTGAEVGVTLPNGDRAFASAADMLITITYFGGPGDYILGTVTGTWHTGPNGQGGPDYPMTGTFSVLRQ